MVSLITQGAISQHPESVFLFSEYGHQPQYLYRMRLQNLSKLCVHCNVRSSRLVRAGSMKDLIGLAVTMSFFSFGDNPIMWPRVALYSWSSCLSFSRAGFAGTHHCARLQWLFWSCSHFGYFFFFLIKLFKKTQWLKAHYCSFLPINTKLYWWAALLYSCRKILLYQAAWLSLYAEGSRQQPRPLETLPWLARQSGLACSYSQRTSSAAQAYTLEDSSTQTKGNFWRGNPFHYFYLTQQSIRSSKVVLGLCDSDLQSLDKHLKNFLQYYFNFNSTRTIFKITGISLVTILINDKHKHITTVPQRSHT